MKKSILFLSTLVLLFSISSLTYAQSKTVVGKIFGKVEADKLFGRPVQSLTISVKDLREALDRTSDYVLFGIKNNKVILRNQYRVTIGKEFEAISPDFVLYKFSKSMVQKLLQSATVKTADVSSTLSASAAASDVVAVEFRNGVMTLSNSFETLELALPCPPICEN